MTFEQASTHRLSRGVYQGQTLAQVAETEAGLRYLDLVLTDLFTWRLTRKAVRVFLEEPTIVARLKGLVYSSTRPD